MKIAAVVIARKGSTRIASKMHRIIAGESLLMRKVNQLKRCSLIDEVYVGTNDEGVREDVEAAGAKFVLREERFCDEKSTSVNDMVKDMVSKVVADVIVWAHPTNPFLNEAHYLDAISLFEASGKPVVAVTVVQDHFWFNELPINHNPFSHTHQVASQLQPLYRQNGGIFIRRKECFLSDGRFVGDNPALFYVNEIDGWDINHEWELEVAQKVLCNYGHTSKKQ